MRKAIQRGMFGIVSGLGWFAGIMIFLSEGNNSVFHEYFALAAILIGVVSGGFYQILKRLDE